MTDPSRPSPAKKVDEARQTALNLNDLLGESTEIASKIAEKKKRNGKRTKLKLKRARKLVR